MCQLHGLIERHEFFMFISLEEVILLDSCVPQSLLLLDLSLVVVSSVSEGSDSVNVKRVFPHTDSVGLDFTCGDVNFLVNFLAIVLDFLFEFFFVLLCTFFFR